MTDCKPNRPGRDTEKSRQEQAVTQRNSVEDRGREPSGAITVTDIGSPYGSTGVRHSYESVDFGESGEELI